MDIFDISKIMTDAYMMKNRVKGKRISMGYAPLKDADGRICGENQNAVYTKSRALTTAEHASMTSKVMDMVSCRRKDPAYWQIVNGELVRKPSAWTVEDGKLVVKPLVEVISSTPERLELKVAPELSAKIRAALDKYGAAKPKNNPFYDGKYKPLE